MNKKIYILISAISLVLALIFLFEMGAMRVKASERSISAKEKSQSIPFRVICKVDSQLMHIAQLQRMDFALSDGRGNALGLRNGNLNIHQDPCDFKLRRLDFALSDGRGNALGLRAAVSGKVEWDEKSRLQRLDFALSDGRGNALGLRTEPSTGLESLSEFNLRRLDFSLSDGRGTALDFLE